MKLKRTHLVSRIANGISFVLLLLLSVFAIWAATLIQQASSTAKQSTFESSTYQQIRQALSEEEVLQYEYMLDPSPALRDEHLAVATSVSAMTHVLPQDDATAGDNALAQHILTEQAHYVFDSGQFFSAIDRKNLTGAHAIYKEIDPSFTSLEKELNQKANEEQAEAAHDLAQLLELEQTIFVTAPIVFGLGLLFLSITISVQRSYHKKLEEATEAERARFNDSLSGLGNHYAYHEQLSRTWQESRHGGEPLTLALLDLDEFKVFNDEQGHQRGDDILRALASLLRKANLTHALFRLSADDFALIMPHTPLTEAVFALERLREDVPRALCGVSVSIGVTQTGPDELPLESFQAQATLALQQAKCRGRNRVVTFETIESAASFVPLAKIQAVRRVLSERKLSMTFQPIWNLATGTVLAFEALAQPAADSGLSGPQELFDIAEHMGRTHELDAICVEKILAHAAELPPDTLLFMNLTPQSLVYDLLTEATLLEGVVSAGLEPSRVVLEITERALVNLAEVVQKARHLRQLGFRIALDDVGAGNAELEMLSQLSVDFVKIDRTVVVKALTDQAVRSVFLGIITITRESQIPVVAEGIENAEMLAFVQQAEVQYAQGYLLGRPGEEIQVSSDERGQNISTLFPC